VGFALPTGRLEELRARLDTYARTRLTLADFEPILDYDGELSLDQVTPGMLDALGRLEPFGIGNPEPVFVAREVRLMAPPRVVKEKHVRLKLASGAEIEPPRCDPESSSVRRRDGERSSEGSRRRSVTFDGMGWRLAELAQQAHLLTGDRLDIAFTVGYNEHPDFGGLELTLRDFKTAEKGDGGQASRRG